MRADSSPGWELEWLGRHPQQFSLYGRTGARSWSAEASTPRVLASAQKLHVLAAFLEQARSDRDLTRVEVPLRALDRHHLEGTDAGAHRLALLADGILLTDLNRRIPMTTLLSHMLYYSSNAAADAIADVLETRPHAGPLTNTLPPRLSAQFREAYLLDPSRSRAAAGPLAAAGSGTYRGTVRYLADLVDEIVRRRDAVPALDAIRLLPRLAGRPPAELRGKRGRLPGRRAGAFVRFDERGAPVVGAYAIGVDAETELEESELSRLEAVLIRAASGTAHVPHVTADADAERRV